MISDKAANYIVEKSGRVIGETREYDAFSREGQIRLYWESRFHDGILGPDLRVMSRTDIESDEKLLKSLHETEYQRWRFYHKELLGDEYRRLRRSMYDFDQFCREYYTAEKKGILSDYLKKCFVECLDYTDYAYFIDMKRIEGD